MEMLTGEAMGRDLTQVKVLLVDDDESTHEVLRLFLGKTEFSLLSAASAPEAMRMINSDPPDILITDAMMPGESGFSLIEKMKSSSCTAEIPVILWTILETPTGSVMDASGKADILLNKPFYRCDIMDSLEKAKLMMRPRSITNDGSPFLGA